MTDRPVHIRRVFVANRGEIAVRIIRTCAALGVETVLGASTVDRDELPARMADRTVCLGPPPAEASYLNVPAIVAAAVGTGCDAIHPGYGFVAESPGFARACTDQGLTFVGPSAAAIALGGDKVQARAVAKVAGIPVLDASAVITDADRAAAAAAKLGYPVMLKAAAGGGGRGMAVVADETTLRVRWPQAAEEARAAFGDGRLYLERYVTAARHVEVQVLGDQHGTVVHLGERDCSLQRRRQKLLEEAPAPALPEEVRRRLRASAVAFASALGLDNAGTVEFVYDVHDRAFAFLEFNARLQVEHPVTEAVTGVDLVAEQLRCAAGQPLDFAQEDVAVEGHAIECRLLAERVADGFVPDPGTITAWNLPVDEQVRVDTHCEPGSTVTPHYDSLLAKVIGHTSDRRETATQLADWLGRVEIEGVASTVDLHRFVLTHPDFLAAAVTTDWLESRDVAELQGAPAP